jgi:hypothetical protein
MKRLIGRRVLAVYGAMHPENEGVVYADQPEGVWVRFENGAREYIAKFRLLCNEYAEYDVPSAVGVYLIAENV